MGYTPSIVCKQCPTNITWCAAQIKCCTKTLEEPNPTEQIGSCATALVLARVLFLHALAKEDLSMQTG